MNTMILLGCTLIGLPLWSGEDLLRCLREGTLLLDTRYRLEFVDQQARAEDALASTLRTRLGFQSAALRGFSFLVEFENIAVIGDDAYNDTTNGHITRPVVADREDTELNRAQLVVDFSANDRLVIGRQRLILADARFIGNVGWRQNEQTFDALLWENKALAWLNLKAAYLHNVNRIFGEHHPSQGDIPMNGFLLHGELKPGKAGKLALLGYFLDNETDPNGSHQDIGFAYEGQWPPEKRRAVTYRLSLVEQDDYRDGGAFIDASYRQARLGGKFDDCSASLNLEILGGDGTYGFATPLATGHAFNGWADLFLATPADGLRDAFASLGYGRKGWRAQLDYHDFEADNGGRAYGKEWDCLLTLAWAKHHAALLKYADYQAASFATDTRKLWLGYQFSY